MAFKLLAIDHVVLRIRNVSKSLDFYCGVLGCEIERNVEDIGLIQLRAGQSLIDLVDIESELGRRGGAPAGFEGRNLDHFALRIESFDEEKIRNWLAQHNIDAGDPKDRYGAEGSGPSFYITDPDGNVVELKGPANSSNCLA
jgi:glyoxylase I family protein